MFFKLEESLKGYWWMEHTVVQIACQKRPERIYNNYFWERLTCRKAKSHLTFKETFHLHTKG